MAIQLLFSLCSCRTRGPHPKPERLVCSFLFPAASTLDFFYGILKPYIYMCFEKRLTFRASLSTVGHRTRMPTLCLVAWGLLLPLEFCILCKTVCICPPPALALCPFLSSVCPCPSVFEICIMFVFPD